MPKLFSNLRLCFGFSQIIISAPSIVLIALSDMSFKLPIGVATMYRPLIFSFIIFFLFIFINSCSPVNLNKQADKNKDVNSIPTKILKKPEKKLETNNKKNVSEKTTMIDKEVKLNNNITVLFSSRNDVKIIDQFVNVLEMGIYDKNFEDVTLQLEYFDNYDELSQIINDTNKNGNIFIGPIDSENTEIAKTNCNNKRIFFSFSSNAKLAGDCIYLINFFPKNELEEIFGSLDEDSKVALLYPENNYGYLINGIIDEIVNESESVLVNRSSYKNDLSNVRTAIKELGKYELRKYELDRQKTILKSKNDNLSKKRLKKLERFKTTTDYDFTHVLIADYGINLLQVAPLLPYYDIDPNIVQFIGTGVIDDENFFFEPSLQSAVFPGVEKNKRIKLINNYFDIYEENLNRTSTLPYDLIGLLNFIYSRNMNLYEVKKLLDSPNVRFEGIDGNFYFKNQIIERDLNMLRISNGVANKIN